MSVLVGIVLLGGIKRIAEVAGKLVPLMAIIYLLATMRILILNAAEVPAAVFLIVDTAL